MSFLFLPVIIGSISVYGLMFGGPIFSDGLWQGSCPVFLFPLLLQLCLYIALRWNVCSISSHTGNISFSLSILLTTWKCHPSLDSASYHALKSLVRKLRSLDSVYTEIYNLICVGDFYMDNHEATQQKPKLLNRDPGAVRSPADQLWKAQS